MISCITVETNGPGHSSQNCFQALEFDLIV